MKLYEIEVVAKIAVHADSALQAKACAVAWVKEKTHADEAAWLSCKEKEKMNK